MFAVRVSGEEEKAVLIAADPEKFFTEPHYNGYPAVLVRLEAIDEDELTELLTDAWRLRAPRRSWPSSTQTPTRRPAPLRLAPAVVYGRAVAVATRAPRAGSARAADVMLLTVVLLWSGNFTAMRYAVESFHPLAFSSLRFGLGAALYALVVWWREGSLRIARRDLGAVVLLAAIGIFLNQVAVDLRRAEGGRGQRRHAHGERADHRRAARAALGHERIGARHLRRRRRRRHGSAARALRRRRRGRGAADRLAARPAHGRDLGDLLGAGASDDGALQRGAASRPRSC